MCYYDMICFSCGDWRWDKFRARCNKEYRVGETCGMRFISQNVVMPNKCKICEKIDTKMRRREKEYERYTRWQAEGGKFKASMERAVETIRELDAEVAQLYAQRSQNRPQTLGGRR
ncbi:hypothetical protein CAC42_6339 [Sphaceloma murrayae]|uniref:Uncharacterized protein n=1 Tax=Sphaceloma murrayae TaxID=2082308 RepID=A0A2K1QMN2_9PEZI|nr:hypothetical protein CAC42_6339 [Sphaceloma murrayae]